MLAAGLTLFGAVSLSRATNDLDTINSGSIPSVDAAQRITQLIEVIDAQSADFLAAAGLHNTMSCTIAGLQTTSTSHVLTVHDCDEQNIDTEIVLVNQQLFAAAHNVTYIGEKTAIERITIGLEEYLGDIQQMRMYYGLATNKTDSNDSNLQQAYQAYVHASAILHDQISLATLGTGQIPLEKEHTLPSCTLPDPDGKTLLPNQWTQGGLTVALDCLSFINYSHLQEAYNDSASFLGSSLLLLALLSILFCALLLFAVVRMATTTHRLLNPGLVAASLIALLFSFNMIALFDNLGKQGTQASQDGAFRQMVMDDYASVYYAALLNRYGTDANADESRWLIAHEFHDQASIQHWQDNWDANVRKITTLMQKAQRNQTWVEEIQPLTDMDTSWKQYSSFDPQIRQKAQDQSNPNRLNDAELLSTGASNRAFSHFTDAVDRLSTANRDHYAATLDATNGALLTSFVLSLILFPLAGLLAVWGVGMRFKDF